MSKPLFPTFWGFACIFWNYFKGHKRPYKSIAKASIQTICWCYSNELFGFPNDVIWSYTIKNSMNYGFKMALVLLHTQHSHNDVQHQTTYTLTWTIINVLNMHIPSVRWHGTQCSQLMHLKTIYNLTIVLNVCKNKTSMHWASRILMSKMWFPQCTPKP
jgi:hypothetical protein